MYPDHQQLPLPLRPLLLVCIHWTKGMVSGRAAVYNSSKVVFHVIQFGVLVQSLEYSHIRGLHNF